MDEKEKEGLTEAFCAKYNETQFLEEGCKHPNDYCPYRNSCLIYFYTKENIKSDKLEK